MTLTHMLSGPINAEVKDYFAVCVGEQFNLNEGAAIEVSFFGCST